MQFACAGDCLGTAIYFELAQDAMDVTLDGAGGYEQPGCDLLIGEAPGDQLEHLPLACGEMLAQRLILPWVVPTSHQWIGARVWPLERREQPPHVAKQGVLECVTRAFAPRLEKLREQGCHRHSFVQEKADVALGFGDYKRSFELTKRVTRFVLRLQCQRTQGEDLDDAPHPTSALCCLTQPIEQSQGIV